MSPLRIPVVVTEVAGLARRRCFFRVGLPLPRGAVFDASALSLFDSAERAQDSQFRALAHWPDRSLKWLLLDGAVPLDAHERAELHVAELGGARAEPGAVLSLSEDGTAITIGTGAATFRIDRKGVGPFAAVTVQGAEMLGGSDLRLTGNDGAVYVPGVDRKVLAEQGPLRVDVVAEGKFVTGPRSLRFQTRTVFHAGSAAVRYEITLLNPHVAHHAGGRWDLGDPGSYYFKDFSLRLPPSSRVTGLRSYVEPGDSPRDSSGASAWLLYQDSSGGERWSSDNHVDHAGKSTVSFRGYELRAEGTVIAQGDRATPGLSVRTDVGYVAASVEDFWQNFPKALRWHDNGLEAALFPAESKGGFELQGGEQKRHAVLLDFGPRESETALTEQQLPPLVHVDPEWIEQSGAVPYFVAKLDEPSKPYESYVGHIIAGTNSFFAKREVIDEYGWRNFGDLYADHEAVNHKGPQPFVSHYNNQYDFIFGAYLEFQRSGDARWHRLMQDLARHVVDIDMYHTNEDKAAFNGGLFWHTDHYKPASTCTHRTYSAANSNGGDYGGGPSNEHNYTSGLLHYHYLTGDEEARKAVLGLAEWVLAMDDGRGTLLTLFDEGPTGLASSTANVDFHKAGRGPGNSINALLDGYALSRNRRYVSKAEELIQRCIHPDDDIAALTLLEPEYRWSYLVFLQVLGKYLDCKREWGELDFNFYYARDSLLHYARWIARNEVPYKDALHKVEIPTETWPAHDIRKAHVLYAAARYAPEVEQHELRERAAFFCDRCVADVTSFATAYLTRPLVILSVYGGVPAYYRKHSDESVPYTQPYYDFGVPTSFLRQRQRVRLAISRKAHVVMADLRRVARDKLRRFKKSVPGR